MFRAIIHFLLGCLLLSCAAIWPVRALALETERYQWTVQPAVSILGPIVPRFSAHDPLPSFATARESSLHEQSDTAADLLQLAKYQFLDLMFEADLNHDTTNALIDHASEQGGQALATQLKVSALDRIGSYFHGGTDSEGVCGERESGQR